MTWVTWQSPDNRAVNTFAESYQNLVHWLHLSLSLPVFTSDTPLLLWMDCLHWWHDWLWPLTPPLVPLTPPAPFFVPLLFPPLTFGDFDGRCPFPLWESSVSCDLGLAIILLSLLALLRLNFVACTFWAISRQTTKQLIRMCKSVCALFELLHALTEILVITGAHYYERER